MKTYKPFTRGGRHQDRVSDQVLENIRTRLRITQDGEWVETMAKSANATTLPEDDQSAIILKIPKELLGSAHPIDSSTDVTQIREEFIKTIRKHLANNQAVLVRKWYPGIRFGFSPEDIGMICPFMQQEVRWQGT